MKRDLILYMMTVVVTIAAAFALAPWVVRGYVWGYEPILWIRVLEYAFIIATLGLAIERLVAWFWRRKQPGRGERKWLGQSGTSGITKIDSLGSPIPLWITFPSPVSPTNLAPPGRGQKETKRGRVNDATLVLS